MKKVLMIMVMAITYSQLHGQQTIFDLTANATFADTCEFDEVYDLDVFKYFKLEYGLDGNTPMYDTELKKTVFKRTEEYQSYLAELKSKRAKMLATTFYSYGENSIFSRFGGGSFPLPSYGDYDVKAKGVYACINSLVTYTPLAPKSINCCGRYTHILLKPLPTEFSKSHGEYLLLPMSEEMGIEYESTDKKDLKIYYFFTPTGKEKVKFDYINLSHNSKVTSTGDYFKADKVRVVLANQATGEIYSDKTYTYKAPASKQNIRK